MTQDEIISLARENCPYTKELLRGAYYEGFVKAANLIASPIRTKDLTSDELSDLVFDYEPCENQFKFARTVIAADMEKNK